jgi:hypothetical protein
MDDFFGELIGDGRALLKLNGLGLILAGLFAVYLSVTEQFLPHDLAFLGMTAAELCAIADCRIVHFMFHNRVSLGGAAIGVGTLHLWLAEFPLRQRQAWAWWLLAASGGVIFSSFLTFLGHGYVDTWHLVSMLVLVPVFVAGLLRTRTFLPVPASARSLLEPAAQVPWSSAFGIGRACLLLSSFGLLAAGATIMAVGMTWVFVPEDLAYLQLSTEKLHEISPRLIPLISHDRACFGGGVCACGLAMLFCVWCGEPSRSLWQALCLSGAFGFSTAIFVHPLIGYLNFVHLAPAVAGAAIFGVGLLLTFNPMANATISETPGKPPNHPHQPASKRGATELRR